MLSPNLNPPQYAINDLVRSKTDRGIGIVIKIYELEGAYRYVIRQDNGSELVFFEYELEKYKR
jgi:hypothetical protein